MAIDLSTADEAVVAKIFDYSVLPKNSTREDIIRGCELTRKYQFKSFCLASGYWIPLIKDELADYPDILLGAAIAFPFGSATAYAKAKETEEAVKLGATTFDVVMNIGALLSRDYDVVREELKMFVDAAQGHETKCILEVDMLTDEDIITGCKLIAEAGVGFAKTSSGQYGGPTMDQFLVMKKACEGTGVQLKVAGVKFPRPQNAYAFMLAGADRIGTRAAPQILEALPMMREIGLVPPPATATV